MQKVTTGQNEEDNQPEVQWGIARARWSQSLLIVSPVYDKEPEHIESQQ